MPSNWLFVDTNFPTFTGEESTDEKISTMQNYMFMLVEQLRYSMQHLDSSNITEIDMDTTKIYSGGTLLQSIIKDNEKFSIIEQNLNEIHAAVYGEEGGSDVVIGEGGIIAQVKGLQDSVSSTVRLDKYGLLVTGSGKDTVQITGDAIFFGDPDDDDNDGTLSSFISKELISSPTIKGGKFSSTNDQAWIKMAEKKGDWGSEYGLVLYDATNWQDGIFSVWSGDFGYTVFSSKLGYGFLQTNADPATESVTVYPLGNWDFSNCDSLTANMTATAVFAP